MVRDIALALLSIVLLVSPLIARPDFIKLKTLPLNPHLITLGESVFPPNNLFKLSDPVLTNGIPLTIRFPSEIYTIAESFEDRSRKILEQSLPQALQQLNVPADQIQGRVDEGIPLLISGIQELLNDEQSTTSSLQRRGILDTLFGWAKDAGCALVAAGGLPLFLLAAADFTAENTDGKTHLFPSAILLPL